MSICSSIHLIIATRDMYAKDIYNNFIQQPINYFYLNTLS